MTTGHDKLWHIKQCPLFSVLNEAEMHAIEESTRMVELARNAVVPPPTGNEPALYIVKKGHVELTYVDEDGREAAVMILEPGDVFGDLSSHGEQSALFGEHCKTISPACLCSISRSRFETLVQRFPDLAFRLSKLSLLRIHRLQVRLAEMMMRPSEARLASALLELDRQVGRDELHGGRRLGIGLSHADLGKLIGTSREMVTILMKRFREAGLVETPKRWIVLKDLKRLEEIAAGRAPVVVKA